MENLEKLKVDGDELLLCRCWAVLLLAELQQNTAFFRGHFAAHLHFSQFITVTHARAHGETWAYKTLTSRYTHATLLTLLGAPSGLGQRKGRKENRAEKKKRAMKKGKWGEERKFDVSADNNNNSPQSAKVRLNYDDFCLIKIQTHYCARLQPPLSSLSFPLSLLQADKARCLPLLPSTLTIFSLILRLICKNRNTHSCRHA